MPSKKSRKKNRSTYKPACHQVEHSGISKSIHMFSANPMLMAFLKVAIAYDYDLFDNPQIGFDMPFVARVDIAMEPSDIFDFIGLYFNDEAAGKKLQGMLQVNALTPWRPSTQGHLTPQQLQIWREARAQCNATGFTRYSVGLVEFISYGYTEDLGISVTTALLIPDVVMDNARNDKPFFMGIPFARMLFNGPISTAQCLERLNLYIRVDGRNQFYLRDKMTQEDKEIIRAAGRNEDTLPARILRKKMERESLYANVVMQNGQV
ncbi:uncharacterized protein F5147DRAFT_41140 [Suillus discolor]|uniref:DUF8205 domain-containing protein n=1 Tax=Suillus discolor TaxID=1912936 RepID=A0A9P7ET03_9AGAM|nr:uncharacterized protein F5147DRAFT_41140 [Suillus discolor]KAG2089335.1 hypothetical protein F5147DRAFT_41140 [Suillus discolor]